MGKHKGEVNAKAALSWFKTQLNKDLSSGRFNGRRRETAEIVEAPAVIPNPHNGGFGIDVPESVRESVRTPVAPPAAAKAAPAKKTGRRRFEAAPLVTYVNPRGAYVPPEGAED
jgi:hypothetical protein